jgi:hypothetical protein
MYDTESPDAVGRKHTEGFLFRACLRMYWSSSGFPGSIEKPPPPSAIIWGSEVTVKNHSLRDWYPAESL